MTQETNAVGGPAVRSSTTVTSRTIVVKRRPVPEAIAKARAFVDERPGLAVAISLVAGVVVGQLARWILFGRRKRRR